MMVAAGSAALDRSPQGEDQSLPAFYSTFATVAVLMTAAIGGAFAQQPPTRCVVNDPTTTPLNLRASPNGAIVGQLANGQTVRILEQTVDARGRSWARITVTVGMAAGREGWVFREFIACF
jgi:Bacterial SH3 domain